MPGKKIQNIYRNTKITITQQGKISNIWYLIRNYLHREMQENTGQNEQKNQSMEIQTELTQVLKLVEKARMRKKIMKRASVNCGKLQMV